MCKNKHRVAWQICLVILFMTSWQIPRCDVRAGVDHSRKVAQLLSLEVKCSKAKYLATAVSKKHHHPRSPRAIITVRRAGTNLPHLTVPRLAFITHWLTGSVTLSPIMTAGRPGTGHPSAVSPTRLAAQRGAFEVEKRESKKKTHTAGGGDK